MAGEGFRRLVPVARKGMKRAATYALSPIGRRADLAKFIIICPPRTGSTLLVSLLDAHPDIRCQGEILADAPRLPVRFLEGRAAVAARDDASAWGCKLVTNFIMWNAERLGPTLFEDLVEASYQFVILRRRNWLLQAVSYLQGIKGQWHHSQTARDDAPRGGVRVVPEEVLHHLWMIEVEDRRAGILADRYEHLSLWYEDDLFDADAQQRTSDRVAAALGLEPAPVATNLVPGLPPRLDERVENLDELAASMRHTRWAHLLDEAP